MSVNVVLHEPEIPQNTGNIARTCVVTNSRLHVIKPMGFSLDEKHIRRAGLDYWKYLDLSIYESIEELWERYPKGEYHYFSTKVGNLMSDAVFGSEPFLVFGKETAGLPRELLDRFPDQTVRIPMYEDRRCLNLSNAVCVGVYEALRQSGYPGLG